MNKRIGNFFLNARLARGFTQKELADELGYTSAQLVSNWERGVCNPPVQSLKKLIKLLRLDAKKVLGLYMNRYKEHLLENVR